MLTLIHKTFGMITHLDDNVLKWIGGSQTNLGETNDEAKTKAAAFYARADTIATGVGQGIGRKNKNPDPRQSANAANGDDVHAVNQRPTM